MNRALANRDRDPRPLFIGVGASQTQTPTNGLAPTPSSETWALGALKLEHGWNTSLERCGVLWTSTDSAVSGRLTHLQGNRGIRTVDALNS
jgi:hypothetical protein